MACHLFSAIQLLLLLLLVADLVRADSVESDESVSTDQNGRIWQQRPHPHSKHFTSVRGTDPIPSCISVLLNEDNDTIIHHIANKSTVNLLILVQSSYDRYSWRATIRSTYKYSLPDNVAIVFVIPIQDVQNVNDLKHESETHQDTVLYLQVHDSSSCPRSAQLIHFLYWLQSIYSFQFLLRTFDNYYINVHKILEILSSVEPTDIHLYIGYFTGNDTVDDPLWFQCPSYIPHALEGGYIISSSLISRFIKHSQFLSYYNNEGASIGLWLSPFKDVTFVHDVNFDTDKLSRGCWNAMIINPVVNQQEMNEYYQRHLSGRPHCIKQFETKLSYIYDWTQLPKHCCEQQISLIDNN